MLKTRVVDADMNRVKLNDGSTILSNTLIWAGGVRPDKLITDLLSCEHDKAGRIIVNSYFEVTGHKGVFAVGDCASLIDLSTGKPYPPTAQYAIKEATIVARNIILEISKIRQHKKGIDNNNGKVKFNYNTKGVMAKIGERNGVGILKGHKVRGLTYVWRWWL